MQERTFTFASEDEAHAFRQGVEYANDSALEVVGVALLEGVQDSEGNAQWQVTVRDGDYCTDHETPDACQCNSCRGYREVVEGRAQLAAKGGA